MAIRKHRRVRDNKMSYYVVVFDKRTEKRVYIGKFDKMADARRAESDAMREIDSSRPAVPGLITVREFATKWIATKKLRPESMRAIEQDVGHICDEFGDARIADLRSEQIEEMAARCTDRFAPLSCARILRRLMQMLKKAEAWGYIASVPHFEIRELVRAPKRQREPRIFTVAEVERIASVAAPKYRALFGSWPYLGLRLGEMLGLQPEDIDFDAGVIHVRRQLAKQKGEPLKTAASKRDVAMTASVARMLREHIEEFHPTEWMWTSPNTQMPLSDGTWRSQVWEPVVTAAEIGAFRSHDFRHTFGAWLIEQGASVQYVQRQMGHENGVMVLTTYNDLLNEQDYSFTHRMEGWSAGTKAEQHPLRRASDLREREE